jgi:hypothetical protein
MIKLRLFEIHEAKDVLTKLVGMGFSIRLGFLLARIVREANKELIDFENKKRELIKKNGDQDKEDGTIWRTRPENQAEVDKQINELLAEAVDLQCDPIKMSIIEAERIYDLDKLLPILIAVKEGKMTPADALKEIQGKLLSLTPIEVARIDRFIVQD